MKSLCSSCGTFKELQDQLCRDCYQKSRKRPKSTKIKRVSNKRRKQNEEYSKLRKHFLENYPFCVACAINGRTKGLQPATDVHHFFSRTGQALTDVSGFMPVCRECHSRLHDTEWGKFNHLIATKQEKTEYYGNY